MSTIPLVSRSGVQSPQLGVRADAGAFTAPGRAIAQAGQAIQQIGAMSADLAMRKQDQINRGALASEETVRMEVAAQIQSFAQNNPDAPEKWGEFEKSAWDSYESSRTTRAKDQKWSPFVQNTDSIRYKQYRAESGIRFKVETDKALIRQSNARLAANAEAKLRGGDYEGFIAAYDEMNLFPDQREAAIRRGLAEGLYKTANNQLDAIREMPLAEAIPAYREFVEALKEKGKDGKYTNYEFDRGGMSLGGRVNLESIANARIRETQRAMDVFGRRLVADVRLGRATTADIQQALENGDIDQDTALALEPDLALASEELKARREAKAQALAQQQQNAAERLRREAVETNKANERDIDRQLALGEISPTQASQLKEELRQASRAEQADPLSDFGTIREEIRNEMGKKLLVFSGAQPDENRYRKIQNKIILAKVTKESRQKLVEELFDLKLADLDDLEEEHPDGRWKDRDITPTERAMRRNLIEAYRKQLPALGPTLAGDLMFNQEAKVREFFDTAKERTSAEVDAFVGRVLLPEIRQGAGFQLLSAAFDF